jgi:hypothetical protein
MRECKAIDNPVEENVFFFLISQKNALKSAKGRNP